MHAGRVWGMRFIRALLIVVDKRVTKLMHSNQSACVPGKK